MRLEYDFADSPGHWIWLTSRIWQRAVNDELKQHGLTMRQLQLLAWLAYEGDLTQAELADRLEVEAATIVGILDRMERDGWIARCPDPHDRRKNVVRPTPQVEPVWNAMVRCLRRVRRQAVTGISPAELEQLRNLLGRIQENLQAMERVGGRAAKTRANGAAHADQA